MAAVDAAVQRNIDGKSFGEHARNLQVSGIITRKPGTPPVVGTSTKFHNIKAVDTKRAVSVFTSSWNPNTTASEVTTCVQDILQGDNSDDVECVRVKSRYEHLYHIISYLHHFLFRLL